jgi:hypothetical protein
MDREFGFPYGRTLHESLPRDELRMDGHNFKIVGVEDRVVLISDGTRTARYRPVAESELDMSSVSAKVELFEAGMFCEALGLRLTDGEHEAAYVPVQDQELPPKENPPD